MENNLVTVRPPTRWEKLQAARAIGRKLRKKRYDAELYADVHYRAARYKMNIKTPSLVDVKKTLEAFKS